MHATLTIDNRHLVGAHLARAGRVISRFGMLTHELVQRLVGLHVDAGADFAATVRVQCRLLHDLASQADAVTELLPVLLAGHVVEQDARVLARVFGFDLHTTTARRTHGADVSLETVLLNALGAVVVNRHRQEVVLNVRPFERFAGANKTTGFKLVARADTCTEEHPLGTDGRLVPPLQRRIQRHRLGAGVLQVHLQVILKVLANARQVMNHRDIQLVQHFGRADAGTLENLWRSDSAATQQHFLAGTGLDARVAVAHQVGHADGTLAFEQNAIGQRVSDYGQGRALLGLVQITTGGTGATTVRRHGAVHRTETFLLITVEVVSARETGLHARLDHRVEQRIVARLGRGHADRTFTTVVIIRADVAGFGLAEVRQAIEVAPVFETWLLGPAVVVHRVAADIAHAVDQR